MADTGLPVRLEHPRLGLCALAWFNRFIQDDAFISFRYARNWVLGRGLVYNAGERVEGYSNFLWTLLSALPISMGVSPVLFAQILGVGLFALTLLFTRRLAACLPGTRWVPMIAVALLGTNYSFSCYATGGLETQLQACLGTAGMALVAEGLRLARWSTARLLGISFIAAAAMLTRMDSILLVGPACLLAAWGVWMSERSRTSRLGALSLPVVLLVGAWLFWKWSYYGSLLPNSFHVKFDSELLPFQGLYYASLLFGLYLLVPALLVFAIRLPRLVQRVGFALPLLLIVPVGLWLAYVIKIGGDFMELRFHVPIAPAVYVAATWGAIAGTRRRWVAALLAGAPAVASLAYATGLTTPLLRRNVLTIHQLSAMERPELNWINIGRALGDTFPQHDVTIALTAAVAVPYYSDLPTIDMHGLTDRWVAKNGPFSGMFIPGHQRMATIGYLRSRGVNLVIGFPRTVAISSSRLPDAGPWEGRGTALPLWWFIADPENLPPGVVVIELPIDRSRALLCLYLTQNEVIDRLIRDRRLRTHPIVRP